MAKNSILKPEWLEKTKGLGTIAAALAMIAMPVDAFAEGGRGGHWNGGGGGQAAQSQPRGGWGGGSNSGRSWGGRQSAQSHDGSSWRSRGSDGSGRSGSSARSWRGSGSDGNASNWRSRNRGGSAATADNSAARKARMAEIERRRGAGIQAPAQEQWSSRNRSYSDPDRNRTYRSGQRSENWRGNNRDGSVRNDPGRWSGRNESWRNDPGRWNGNNNRWRNNGNRWDRNWRRDNRYDWHSYRNNHRSIYRLGRYYSPYRGYSYRRLGVGFYLDSLFFGSNYWIDDPWYYRLPPADGPYRWIRYYGDALLVDTYSGEVIDVIYDFFE